jgi:hypothetical protein
MLKIAYTLLSFTIYSATAWSSFDLFPLDIKSLILSQSTLEPIDLYNFAQTSKGNYSLCKPVIESHIPRRVKTLYPFDLAFYENLSPTLKEILAEKNEDEIFTSRGAFARNKHKLWSKLKHKLSLRYTAPVATYPLHRMLLLHRVIIRKELISAWKNMLYHLPKAIRLVTHDHHVNHDIALFEALTVAIERMGGPNLILQNHIHDDTYYYQIRSRNGIGRTNQFPSENHRLEQLEQARESIERLIRLGSNEAVAFKAAALQTNSYGY